MADEGNKVEETAELAKGKFQTYLESVGVQVKALGNSASGTEMIALEAKDIEQVAAKLKKEQKLSSLCYMTALEVKDGYQVVYQLDNPIVRESVVLKVTVPKVAPVVPSLHKVYGAANWQEREAYDMIGIEFDEHPDLKRILNPDNWEGFPLRKDYIGPIDGLNEPINYV